MLTNQLDNFSASWTIQRGTHGHEEERGESRQNRYENGHGRATRQMWDSMTRKQLMATATEYRAERDAAKSDTLRAFDERNALLDARRLDCDWLGHRNEILEEAAKACEDLERAYWEEYKRHKRADARSEALSDGACECAAAIRALKT